MDRWQESNPIIEALDFAVACVFIPHFPLRVEILRHPELDGLPLALAELASAARRKIAACSPEAVARGVRPGMAVRDAVNACPRTTILTADPVHYANIFADLLRALGAVSPGVEAGEPGIAWVDLRGLNRLHGGIDALVSTLLASLPATLRPRLGLAANKFTARVAASRARPGGSHAVPAAYGKAFLANCPVDLLPVSPATRRRLEQFGLYQLRDIARLPVGKLQAQFGPDGRRAWELAHGRDSDPFRPITHDERLIERLTMPSPTVQIDALLMGVERLVARVYSRPEMRHRGARGARLQLLLEERRSWERTFALKGSAGDPQSLCQTLRHRLRGLTLDGAVEEIVLELFGLSGIHARQEQLFDADLRQRQRRDTREAIRQLRQRYGVTPIYRVVPLEPWSRIPERRWGLFGYE